MNQKIGGLFSFQETSSTSHLLLDHDPISPKENVHQRSAFAMYRKIPYNQDLGSHIYRSHSDDNCCCIHKQFGPSLFHHICSRIEDNSSSIVFLGCEHSSIMLLLNSHNKCKSNHISSSKFFCLFYTKNHFFYFTHLLIQNTHISLSIIHTIFFK